MTSGRKNSLKDEIREYWETHPNAVHIAGGTEPGSKAFFQAIESHRYSAEPCIPEMARFQEWSDRRVLEVGCGIGTDLRQFAGAGATVIGMDLTWSGIRSAKQAFEVFGLRGDFVVADAEALPFRSESFDLVYSNGVIHHTPNVAGAVIEIHRVLMPRGQACVMVYHRNSYFLKIIIGLILSPLLRTLLLFFPGGRLPELVSRILPPGIRNIYGILAERGYSNERLVAVATDPSVPGTGHSNPLSRCYSQQEAKELFSVFSTTETRIRQLYLADFLPRWARSWLERRAGWFLFIRAVKQDDR
jgi:ubiquinone/menaquinone biosynthesis C-methylase UbiE